VCGRAMSTLAILIAQSHAFAPLTQPADANRDNPRKKNKKLAPNNRMLNS